MAFKTGNRFSCSCTSEKCHSDCELYSLYIERNRKTNADRIRAMSDEELAKYLAWLVDKQTCSTEWLIWLKDEVSE